MTSNNPQATIGHNSKTGPQDVENISGMRLKSFIERIERLNEEKAALGEDIRDVYSESKGAGFDPKILRRVVTIRKTNLEKRREEAELTQLYMAAIGMAE